MFMIGEHSKEQKAERKQVISASPISNKSQQKIQLKSYFKLNVDRDRACAAQNRYAGSAEVPSKGDGSCSTSVPVIQCRLLDSRKLAGNLDNPPGSGFQAHHIIPNEIVEAALNKIRLPFIGGSVGGLANFFDQAWNGIWLPGPLSDSRKTRLPVHMGSHETYTDMVQVLINLLSGKDESRLIMDARFAIDIADRIRPQFERFYQAGVRELGNPNDLFEYYVERGEEGLDECLRLQERREKKEITGPRESKRAALAELGVLREAQCLYNEQDVAFLFEKHGVRVLIYQIQEERPPVGFTIEQTPPRSRGGVFSSRWPSRGQSRVDPRNTEESFDSPLRTRGYRRWV